MCFNTAPALQCAAFDANDSTIALGDASGRITVWHNFTKALGQWASSAATAAAAVTADVAGSSGSTSSSGQLPPCTTAHWHASAVGALCFSSDGGSLLSAGREGVLVSDPACDWCAD
jgi:NET1-associated nuclear protein 1 (U3 small nucleolar RNA-associated protein 17)